MILCGDTNKGNVKTRPTQHKATPRWVSKFHCLMVLILVFTLSTPNHSAWAKQVTNPDLESKVLLLLKPYGLGSTVIPGWTLKDISTLEHSVQCTLLGPNEESATLKLALESDESADQEWLIQYSANSKAASNAIAQLQRAIEKNTAESAGEHRQNTHTEHVMGGLLTDTLFLSFIALGLLLLLCWRALQTAPTWTYGALLALTVSAATLRWWMAPDMQLGAWYAVRDTFLLEHAWDSHLMPLIRQWVGEDFTQVQTISMLNFAYAVVTPIAIFVHGKYLLGSVSGGLIAAALVAFLPIHIRFSQSEVAFIPSIVLSSLLFGLTHACLKERSQFIHTVAMIFLPVISYVVFRARPLNIIFMPLIAIVAWGLLDKHVSKRQRIAVTAVVSIVGLYCAITELVAKYMIDLHDGTDVQTITNGFKMLLSSSGNTLFSTVVTSPVFTLLTIGGAIVGLRSQRKRITVFIIGWYFLFFFTHAYVVPANIEMQARYHLHLVVPTVFLAVIALQWMWDRQRTAAIATGIFLAFTPWMHSTFIADIQFNEHQEHAFVERISNDVDDDCVVIEYTGDHPGSNKFRRFGLNVTEKGPWQRFNLYEFKRSKGDEPLLSKTIIKLTQDPPRCAYYYEGLQCWNAKEKSEPIAPACANFKTLINATPVKSHRYATRTYDVNQSKGIHSDQEYLELTLYRLHPPTSSE